jgi:hypothetical protein
MGDAPLFVRPPTDVERQALEDGLRASDAFVLRRAQIILGGSARYASVSSFAARWPGSRQGPRPRRDADVRDRHVYRCLELDVLDSRPTRASAPAHLPAAIVMV